MPSRWDQDAYPAYIGFPEAYRKPQFDLIVARNMLRHSANVSAFDTDATYPDAPRRPIQQSGDTE